MKTKRISSQHVFGYMKYILYPDDYKPQVNKGKRIVSLPEVVGKGYGTFWNWKGRYRAVKGSRASKKSKTTALWFITNMMKYPDANTLVVRKTYRTLKDSCFTELKYGKERIIADSAEPKSIDQLKGLGLKVKGAEKGKDSVNHGIQFIQDYEIIIHPRCVNFLTEISNYTWDKDKLGNKLNRPIDDFNHLMDAMRYALEKFIAKGGRWMY